MQIMSNASVHILHFKKYRSFIFLLQPAQTDAMFVYLITCVYNVILNNTAAALTTKPVATIDHSVNTERHSSFSIVGIVSRSALSIFLNNTSQINHYKK